MLVCREGGAIGLFITLVPKVLRLRFVICWLNIFGDFYWILFGWFINLNVQVFQIYRRDDVVYNHWKCATIYRPLSYAYRCLAWLCVCARLSVCLCACLLLCLSVCLSVWLSVMAVVKLFNRRRFYVCVWLYLGIILNKITSKDYRVYTHTSVGILVFYFSAGIFHKVTSRF